MKEIRSDIAKVLVSEEEINSIVDRIAKEIDRDYAGDDKKLVLICILKGSLPFMGDLMKRVTVPVEIDCMKVSSYGAGTESSGQIHIALDLIRPDIASCDLLIIEDIVDSGRTLYYLKDMLKTRKPASVKICTLLDKIARREVDIVPDYKCFDIGDEFVVGYGLDYAEKYRNLPEIGVLKRSIYEK